MAADSKNSANGDEKPTTPSASDGSQLAEKSPEAQAIAALTEDPHYAEQLASQIRTVDSKVGLLGIFRYASFRDYVVLACGALGAIVAGAILPSFPVSAVLIAQD